MIPIVIQGFFLCLLWYDLVFTGFMFSLADNLFFSHKLYVTFWSVVSSFTKEYFWEKFLSHYRSVSRKLAEGIIYYRTGFLCQATWLYIFFYRNHYLQIDQNRLDTLFECLFLTNVCWNPRELWHASFPLTHCDNKPRQIGLNPDYNMTFFISIRECWYSQFKFRVRYSKREPFRVLLPLLRHVVPINQGTLCSRRASSSLWHRRV